MSFLIGLIFAFFANKIWTFKSKKKSLAEPWKFILIYTSSLITNIYANMYLLYLLQTFFLKIALAFLFATICSATINFLGMKYFVFNRS